ncbi:F-box/kelch-repeat protein At3g23880-like [Malus sylvestris]|uniref:F-box/kelch-repeat protein At3g23880-like n=1 Tax=Malus sylvestris TaxID=3752 RepID=UPI0021AC0ED2|nr:F-box/kelch-repeat protein At3g23880-like [Malus sylvestris]
MLPSLFRSPIRNLTKRTSVCKAWRLSPLFLVHRVSGQASSTLLHKAIVDDVTNEVYSLHYDNRTFDEYSKVEFPVSHMGKLSNSHLRVVGTCNGLICLADDIFRYGYNFFLWNPAIRKLLKLPVPGFTYRTHGGYDARIGFSFDDVTNDYKVVRIVTLLDDDEKLAVAEVYSLAIGSWTSLGSLAQCQLRGAASQAFVNGALRWPALRWGFNGAKYFILTFDVGSQLFG